MLHVGAVIKIDTLQRAFFTVEAYATLVASTVYNVTGKDKKGSCSLSRIDSTTCLFPVEEKAVEYYFASDAR